MKKVLSAAFIAKFKPDHERRTEIPDAACPGLYLVVQPSGVKSWAFRHRRNGRPSKLTLGRYADAPEGEPVLGGHLSLAGARKLAGEALATLDRGQDPSRPKRSRDHNRIEAVVAEFLKRYVKAKALRSAPAIERTFLVDVLPHWQGRRVDEITRRDILELLDAHVDRGAPVQANRTLAAVRRFFNWAVDRDLLKASPADGVKPPTAERSRDRILTDNEIVVVWRACEARGQPFGPLVQLLILTGQRLGEAAGMTHAEADLKDGLWTIPAARAKNNLEHVVPLSKQALTVLRSVKAIEGPDGYIFTTNGRKPVSGFGKAKAGIDKAAALPHWTLHDLRRTAASGMARLGHPVHVVEAVLNHRSGSVSGVAAVYNRYSYAKEKQLALAAWGAHVDRLLAGKSAKNVVSLRAKS